MMHTKRYLITRYYSYFIKNKIEDDWKISEKTQICSGIPIYTLAASPLNWTAISTERKSVIR